MPAWVKRFWNWVISEPPAAAEASVEGADIFVTGDALIELIVDASQFYKTYSVPYFDGEKIPHLERTEGQPDILGNILKPKTGAN